MCPQVELTTSSSGSGASAWENLVATVAKLEFVAGAVAGQGRLEEGGSYARYKGILEVKAAQTLKTTEQIMVIPAPLRPKSEVTFREVGAFAVIGGVMTACKLLINENGSVSYKGPELKAADQIILDGLTYNLT